MVSFAIFVAKLNFFLFEKCYTDISLFIFVKKTEQNIFKSATCRIPFGIKK